MWDGRGRGSRCAGVRSVAQQNPYSRSTSPSRASCDPVTSACPATFARSGQRLRALPNPFQALCQKTRLFSEDRLSPVCAAASSSTAAACGNLDLALDNVGATHLTAWWNHISDRTAATWRDLETLGFQRSRSAFNFHHAIGVCLHLAGLTRPLKFYKNLDVSTTVSKASGTPIPT